MTIVVNSEIGVKDSKLHHLWYLVSRTIHAKNLNYMPRDLKVSYMMIANMIPFINIGNILK